MNRPKQLAFARRLVSKALNGGRRQPEAGSHKNSHREEVRGGNGNVLVVAPPTGGVLSKGGASDSLTILCVRFGGASTSVSQRVRLALLVEVARLKGTVSELKGCQKRGVTRLQTNHPETNAIRILIFVIVKFERCRDLM